MMLHLIHHNGPRHMVPIARGNIQLVGWNELLWRPIMHRAYVDSDWIDSYVIDAQAVLPESATERFLSIVRIKHDEFVAVFDGTGREVTGMIARGEQGRAHFTQSRLVIHEKNSSSIVLVQAALDEAKIVESIKRSCEYGVDEIVIWQSERSEKFVYQRLLKKSDRLMRVAQDACRQSGRVFIPAIRFKESLGEFVDDKPEGLLIFGDTKEQRLLSSLLTNKQESDFYIAVGPEGGISDHECAILKRAGFVGAIWAPHILRSELAGLAAVAIYHAFTGRA